MDQAIELAVRLGRSIAQSPQAQKLRTARAELDTKEDIKALLAEYQKQSDKVAELQEQNKPIEVDDKHKLQGLHEQLVGNDVFKQFTSAQVDYVDMMRKVNQAIADQLGEIEGDAPGEA